MQPNLTIRCFATLVFLASLHLAIAQPTVSSVPVNGATGVPPGAAVVFTFSTNMDTTATDVSFSDVTASFDSPPVVSTWSAGNKVLTCTPSPQFANNHNIQWQIFAQDTIGNFMFTNGSFTTVAGVGGGSGTNAFTTFRVGKLWVYLQTNSAAPVLSPYPFLPPYEFSAQTILASNRTATNVTMTIPVTSGVSNLVQNLLEPESFDLDGEGSTNLTTFNTTFPSGDYVFKVSGTTSNQQVTVALPVVTQPNAPQVSNFNAAQAIDPSQPFTLTWNAFTGGSSADWILLLINGNPNPIFQTPDYGQTGALTGTATSVTIPAGTLQSSSNYVAALVFYRGSVITSGTLKSYAYVGSLNYFNIHTTGTVGAAPVLTNAAWSGGTFGFNILTAPGQTVTVIYNTNLSAAFSGWPILLTTNSTGSLVHISDPHSTNNKTLFYRARNGT